MFPSMLPMLKCYSIKNHPNLSQSAIQNAIYGGKISLPGTFLKTLEFVHNHLQIKVMLYRLTPLPRPSPGEFSDEFSEFPHLHCGVLDYDSNDNGICYLPPWMMRQLKLTDGHPVWLHYITNNLPNGTFVKFKPLLLKRVLNNIDNNNIGGMRSLLESQLKKYQCLTGGDEIDIAVGLNNDEIRFRVDSILPSRVINITNCDLKVDFDDYYLLTETAIFDEHSMEPVIDPDYEPGQLCFIRRQGYLANKLVKEMDKLTDNDKTKTRDDKDKKVFTGKGHILGRKQG